MRLCHVLPRSRGRISDASLKPARRIATCALSRERPKPISSCPSASNSRPQDGRQRSLQYGYASRRSFFSESLPTVLVPPAVFLSLLVGLWTYKCIMAVLFQDKIIYMPYMPPFARSEKTEDYAAICKPVKWESLHVKSLDGTKIALVIGRLPEHISTDNAIRAKTRKVVIAYFHGNGSSIPPRLPLLSGTLKAIERASVSSDVEFVIVALSYRGYWTSSGRASQAGIEKDAQAMLQWVQKTYGGPGIDLDIMLWGQSIGAGVASTAAAAYVTAQAEDKPPVAALVLETPFTGIKSMLLALYPQKWLPYKYLWPFLWNHWDSEVALRRIADSGYRPKILLLPATRDEFVPRSEVDKLESICNELQLPMKRKDIVGALHFEATICTDGQEAVARFVADTIQSRRSSARNSCVR